MYACMLEIEIKTKQNGKHSNRHIYTRSYPQSPIIHQTRDGENNDDIASNVIERREKKEKEKVFTKNTIRARPTKIALRACDCAMCTLYIVFH